MDRIIVSIPAYNEETMIGRVIQRLREIMEVNKYNYKILVVDDGSRDKTAKVAKNAGALVYSNQFNMGLAETFRTELQKCLELKADIIVHIDADGQYLASDIPKLIAEINKGYELVLGSRFRGKIESMPFIKRFGNRAFSRAISNITKTKITDAQTGFRAFTAKLVREIPITSSHTYTQEQIIRAVKQKFRVKEVPVYFAKRKHGKSRLMKGPFQYAFRAWINILRVYRDYEPLKFFGSFGLTLILISLIAGIFPLYLLFSGQYERIDKIIPTIILIILIFLSGLQITLFGFLADKK